MNIFVSLVIILLLFKMGVLKGLLLFKANIYDQKCKKKNRINGSINYLIFLKMISRVFNLNWLIPQLEIIFLTKYLTQGNIT